MDRPVPEGTKIHDVGEYSLLGRMCPLPSYSSGDSVRYGGAVYLTDSVIDYDEIYRKLAEMGENKDPIYCSGQLTFILKYGNHQAEVWCRPLSDATFFCS